MTQPAEAIPPDLFAAYQPRRSGDEPRAPLSGLVIRPSLLPDRDALAEIAWQRNGGELASYVQRFDRDLSNHGKPLDALWLTAEAQGRIVAYAKVSFFEPPVPGPVNVAPGGYYFGGVTVRPEFRRRGIGHELTRQRLEWIARRAREAYYFVNAQNRASIDLHAAFGFVELTRDFFIPGASFVGGEGILFRAELHG